MKRILIRAIVAVIAFALGIASAVVWIKKPSTVSAPTPSGDCVPRYDESVVGKNLRENDDPQLFRAFQELPLYAMPDCVDEAYSLTWISSFHAPVLVRVWRSGDHAFMVAKELDTKGWSKFGKVKDANGRPLTNFEWRDFTALLNRNAYWELSSTAAEINPEDGTVWLIDGLRSRQFHWVRRRVPNEEYADICKHLIRLSGLETAHDLYLP
ncbi:MAG TPA: hypothetical protein VFH31_14810 [Pyrinomonadaceae bacterium]|nr:hypothetical protein [Pyrinomonadaceae bacterium]